MHACLPVDSNDWLWWWQADGGGKSAAGAFPAGIPAYLLLPAPR
jgi:hypothetical protein